MNLGGEFTRSVGATTLSFEGYAVGPAPLGPLVFMHRPSAAENPQAPLSHHYLDATHITTGVVTIGVERSGFRAEVGAFHGREPDEDRLDLDTSALDSYGGRLSWADGAWSIQLSGADLKTPERTSPYDARRVTASVSFFKGDQNRAIAWLAAFGQNREFHGNLEAYLIEAARRVARNVFYARAESVAKDILDAGFHPIGTAHSHRESQVSALTLGYVRDLARHRWGTIGVGGDVTGYVVPANLGESYGSALWFPRSAMLPVRGSFLMGSALPAALALALLLQPTPSAKPDFFGTWMLDQERSESAQQEKPTGPVTLAVSQTGDTLRIETRRGDEPEVVTYVFEARPEGTSVMGAGTRRAYWDGLRLVTEGGGNVQGQTVSIKQTRSLNALGTEMTIDATVTVQHGYTLRGTQNYAVFKDIYIRTAK